MEKIIERVTRVSAYLMLVLSAAPVLAWVIIFESGAYSFLKSILACFIAFSVTGLMLLIAGGLEAISNVYK